MESRVEWLEALQDYYWVHDVLRLYTGLQYWVIRELPGGEWQWMDLTPPARFLLPLHFEIYFGNLSDRDAYYRQGLTRVSRRRPLHRACRAGFWDFFAWVGEESGRRTVLYAGQFCRKVPDEAFLCRAWREIARREPASGDPDFLRFVRTALELPVLEGGVLPAVERFILEYVNFLARKGPPGVHRRINRLRRRVFARLLPNSAWVREALGLEKWHPSPWEWYPDRELAPWMWEELGIRRLPTTVLALLPKPPAPPWDPVEALVANARLQRECFFFAKSLEETVAERMGDEGVVFLTSPGPRKGEAAARLELRERAEAVRRFVQRRFGWDSRVGVGPSVPRGESLYPSFRGALLALHGDPGGAGGVRFSKDAVEDRRPGEYPTVHAAARLLASVLEKGRGGEVRLAAEGYAEEVFRFSGQNRDMARGQFLAFLFGSVDSLVRDGLLTVEEAGRWRSEVDGRFREALTHHRLLTAFQEELARLLRWRHRPLEGSKSLRFEAVRRRLQENYREPLRLSRVAAEAGFSVPTLARLFRKETGTSFSGYLHRIRLEEARRRLRATDLSVGQISQACGFPTVHHFIRVFRRDTGKTPGAYRRRSQG